MKYFILTLCLLTSTFNFSYSQVIESDSLAMVDFYNSLDGDNWKINTNWLSSAPMSEWYGLGVQEGRITGISMRNNFCSGYINSSFGNCTELKNIFLEENEITGIADFDSLHQLTRLNLYENKLTEFPAFIVKCKNLERINLFDNLMEGNIPPEINNLTQLNRFYLTQNKLAGEVPPLKALKNLLYFDLSLNDGLEGDLKDILYDTLSLLTLTFSNTNISGEILPTYYNEESTSLRLFADSSNISGVDKLNNLEFARIWLRHTDLGFDQLLSVQDQNLIDVYYYDPQNLVPGPADMSVVPGSDLTLTCNMEGAEDFQWYKDGQSLADEKSMELNIAEFTAEDAGEYYCTGYHSALPDLLMYQDTTTVSVGSTNTEDENVDQIQVYPNPASDYIRIRNLNHKNATFLIFNNLGKIMEKGVLSNDRINVETLDSGIYTLVINEASKTYGLTLNFIKL